MPTTNRSSKVRSRPPPAKPRDAFSHEQPVLKVMADHIRACSFLLADLRDPGHEGRATCMRRIIRRAIRHGYKLGPAPPSSTRWCPTSSLKWAGLSELQSGQDHGHREAGR